MFISAFATRQPRATVISFPARLFAIAGLVLSLQLFSSTSWAFFWKTYSIPSSSMLPTLEVGDYIWVSRLAYGKSWFSDETAEPKLGDIIVYLRSADNAAYVRRIVGLPGERIQYRGGRLYINDVLVERQLVEKMANGFSRYEETLANGYAHAILEESDEGYADNTKVFTVPEGHYFGLGDNRDNSLDSRFSKAGFIPRDRIVGRFVAVFWNSERLEPMFERRR